MNLLNAYFQYMRAADASAREIFSQRHAAWGVLGYGCAALCMALFFNVGDGLSPLALFAKFAVLFAMELVIGYFAASLSGLFLDFSGVKSSPAQLFTLIGTAGFIKSVLLVFALIKTAAPFLGFLGLPVWGFVLASQLVYLVKNLKRLYGVSVGRALAALAFAVLPLLAAGAVLGALFVWALIRLF